MQRVVNNGSFLQAYALKEALKTLGKCEVQFIDFHNTLKNKKRKNQSFILQLLRDVKHIVLPQYRSYRRIKKYVKKSVDKLTEELPILGLRRELNDYQGNHYDLVVIGSDEVFNLCQFSDENVEIPWCLLGEGIDTDHLVSYAASCGQTSVDSLRAIGEERHFGSLLIRFQAISVRDENTFYVVRSLSGVTPQYHIDPVMLPHDFPKDASYQRLPFKYMLIYAYTQRIKSTDEIQAIQAYARKSDLKTVCVNCFQDWCDHLIVCSPFAVLQYVRDAECVVSDTFHGVVFAIRENTPFTALIRQSNSNKIRFLLHQFGLESREAKHGYEIESILRQTIDFREVNRRLEEERKKAHQYLREQIESVEEEKRGA